MNDPGSVHGLTVGNILTAFPIALQGDQDAAALAEVTARLLARRPEEIDRLRIYPNIHRLDEKLLDLLAYDFKVDWWDADYNLAEKRRTLADSWRVHKLLGTKSAVETALRAIYPNAEVQEWFEYGGEPYFFKLNIDLTGEISNAARPWRVLERVNFYKSLRSHVDKIVFTFVLPPATLRVGGGVGAQPSIGVPLQPDSYHFQDDMHIGGDFGAQTSIGVPNQPDVYEFQDTLHTGVTGGIQSSNGVPVQSDDLQFAAPLQTGGTFAAQAELPVPEDTTQPSATTILRSGGVFTFISNLSGED